MCGGNFRCWPKADTSSAICQSHDRTRNRARKVSGTQGSSKQEGTIMLKHKNHFQQAKLSVTVTNMYIDLLTHHIIADE